MTAPDSDPAGDSTNPADDLVRGAANGDEIAWARLVRQYSPLVRRVARGYRLSPSDVDDVVQVTWLKLAQHIGEIRDPGRVAGWLACTARRECIQLFRRRRSTRTLDGLELADDERTEPEAVVVAADERRQLNAALGKLPDRQERLLRVLMASPPPSYEDAARMLRMPRGSIGPLRRRALTQLHREVVEIAQ
jgi:RNA polymerase sigma factor (sigma-70 family)